MNNMFELVKLIEFSSNRIIKKDILEANGFNLALICLDSGQVIPPHMEGYDAVFYVLDGEGIITVGKEEHSVLEGSLVLSPKQERRGIRSIKRLSLLGIRENVTEKSTD